MRRARALRRPHLLRGAADADAGTGASAESQLGEDGYPLPRQLDVRLVAESTHAVLRLWGLRPRILIFRDREALAAYRDGDGDEDDLGAELEGAGGDEGAEAEAEALASAGADGEEAIDAGANDDGPLVLLEATAALEVAPVVALSRSGSSGGGVLF